MQTQASGWKSLVLSALFVLGGCTAPVDTNTDELEMSEQELANALTITSQDRTNGLKGQFSVKGRTIHFETRREFGADATAIEENGGIPVSVRYLDSDGRVIFMSIAGHTPSDWQEPEAPVSPAEASRRDGALPLISKAVQALALRRLDPSLDQEKQALSAAAVSVDEIRRLAADQPAPEEVGTAATSYKQLFTIHRKWLVYPTEHSATRWYNYYYYNSAWRYYNSIQYCNHGTCPGGSGMSQKCSTWNSPGGYIGSSQTCDQWTGYAVCGAFGGNHNCHDDTGVQRARVVYRTIYSSKPSVCDNWGCSYAAPNCR